MATPDFVELTLADIRSEYAAFFAAIKAEELPAVNDALRRLAINLLESGGAPTAQQNHTRLVIIQELKNRSATTAVQAQKIAEAAALRLFDRVAAHLINAAT